MRTEIGEWTTFHYLTKEEAIETCKLGEGEECCAYLVFSAPEGFQCVKDGQYPSFTSIGRRLEEGTMVAKGLGSWGYGCPVER